MNRSPRPSLVPLTLSLLLLLAPMLTLGIPTAHAQNGPSILAAAVDEAGAPMPGACFSPVGIGPGSYGAGFAYCDDDDGAADGLTSIYFGSGEDGPLSLYQVTAPEGYRVGGRTEVELVEGQTVEVQISQKQGGEILVVSAVDEDGRGVPGACVRLARDNGIRGFGLPVAAGCAPEGSTDGTIRVGGVPPGSYLMSQEYVDGFRYEVGPQDVDVTEGEEATAEVVYLPIDAAEAEGSLTVTVEDDAGEPVLDLCVTLDRVDAPEGESSYFSQCDRYDQTAGQSVYESDGTTLIDGLPDGTYLIEQPSLPAGYKVSRKVSEIVVENGSSERKAFEVERGGQSITILYPPQEEGRSDACTYVSEDTEELSTDRFFRSVCPEELPDGTYGGSISVVQGNFVVTQLNNGIEGFAPIPDQRVKVGRDDEVSITLEPAEEAVIEVSLVNEKGDPLGVGCLALYAEIEDHHGGVRSNFDAVTCDSDDGLADGLVIIDRLPAGTFSVVPVAMPRSRQLPEPVEVTVKAGKTAEIGMESPKGGGRAAITLADERADQQLNLDCVVVYADDAGEPGAEVARGCDSWDADFDDDVVNLAGLPAGDYLVAVDILPFFVPEVDLDLVPMSVVDGETADVTITIPELAPGEPDETGIIVDAPNIDPLPLSITDGETAEITLAIPADADSS